MNFIRSRSCTDFGVPVLMNISPFKSYGSSRIRKGSSAYLRLFKRLISAALTCLLILPCFPASIVRAELITNATVTASSANIRSTPDTTSPAITRVVNGNRVAAGEVVQGEAVPNFGNLWCRISVIVGGTQFDGYIVNSFLQKDPTATDPNFETSIAGFPESYKQSLRSLHEAHPSWIFNPVNVATDWNTVVAEESSLGTSLITSSVDDAWKSTEGRAYNWLTNTYTPYDDFGSARPWENASTGVVAFYLDPRNFLSDMYVFQFLNLSYDPATQTQDAVQTLLNSTFMSGNLISDPAAGTSIPYAQAFIEAGSTSGTSPYQFVSRVIQEVGSQGSRSTTGTEPGYTGIYNFYNIGASSSAYPVILGLNFAMCGSSNPQSPMSAEGQAKYLIPWNSQYRSIVGGAIYIARNYIQKGQNTLYFQKFDVTDGGNGMYRHQYMTNIQAMVGESTTLYNAYAKSSILTVPLTFNIPVYANMPAAAASLPAKTGNPNNYLASLAIDGYSLTPSFDASVTDGYSLIVPYEISSVNLTASPVSATSSIGGTGARALNTGDNIIPIAVTAQNGSVRTYNITIVRNEPTGETLFTTTYRINADNTVAGITPGTTVAAFAAGVTLQNGGQIVFLNETGAPLTDTAHVVATGDRVQILNVASTPVYDYSALIYGDANRDGKISSSDLTLICRHVLKQSSLAGISVLSSDANHDGKISSSDLTIICRQVLKQSTITQ